MNISKYGLLIFLINVFVLGLTAQDRFERMYRSDGTQFKSIAMDAAGGGYVVASISKREGIEEYKLNVAQLDSKGNIDWSNEYLLSDDEFVNELSVQQVGDIIKKENGNILVSLVVEREGMQQMLLHLTPNGDVISTSFSGAYNPKVGIYSSLINSINGEALAIGNNSINRPTISSFDTLGQLVNTDYWTIENTSGVQLEASLRSIINLSDSTLLVVGHTVDDQQKPIIIKMDTLRNILWSRTYDIEIGGQSIQTSLKAVELLDSSIAVLGLNGSDLTINLLQIDPQGDIIQVRHFYNSFNQQSFLIPVGIDVLKDSSVVIGAVSFDFDTEEESPVIFSYDLDSTILYQSQLKTIIPENLLNYGDFASFDSVSAVMLCSSENIDEVTSVPYLIKLDQDGATDCSESIEFVAVDTVANTSVDTIIITKTSDVLTDTMMVIALPYGGFNPPLLTLPDTSYCPQDPINFEVDASVRGAKSYLWDDGSRDSIRIFTKEGMYSVTVVVGIEECFTLCDTTNITKKSFPEVEIIEDNINYCSNGEINLFASSNNAVTSYQWSTGETTPFITITDDNNYQVTIIDDCGNQAEATYRPQGFNTVNNPSIDVTEENLCIDNTLILTAIGDFDIADLQWSTGDMGVASIVVDEARNYSVENQAEFCPGMATISINEDQFWTELEITLNKNCQNELFTLSASIDQGIATSSAWSNNTTGNTTVVSAAGEYTFSAIDVCGNAWTGSIEVTQEDIDDCVVDRNTEGSGCVLWPNAFYPQSIQDINKTFGPEIGECIGMQISDYELKIYNRWGNQVFESNLLNERWNGTKNNTGSNMPPETYFYYSAYQIDGESYQYEGDILLIR